MNLQDELSRNARDISTVTLENEKKAEQLAISEAENRAQQAINNIKERLLNNVQQGDYSRSYNRGKVVYDYQIPGDRYLKLNVDFKYNRKNVREKVLYQFAVKQEYSREYEHFRALLDTWAKENNVEVNWVVKADNYLLEEPFPNTRAVEFSSAAWPKFKLIIRVVSYFPIDPSLPIDHMTSDDIRDKKQKDNARLARMEELCRKKKKEAIMYGCLAAAFFVAVLFTLIIKDFEFDTELWRLILSCSFVITGFGIWANTAYTSYTQLKVSIEKEKKNND